MATINWETAITTLPAINNGLLPQVSTKIIPGTVIPTLTILVASWIRKGFSIPERLKN